MEFAAAAGQMAEMITDRKTEYMERNLPHCHFL
jgi:hypothetical protein